MNLQNMLGKEMGGRLEACNHRDSDIQDVERW